jgi:hypothetical protein
VPGCLVLVAEESHNTKEGKTIPAWRRAIMRPEDLYHLLHRRPFEPFRISLTDGRVFDIRYPKINIVGISYIIIGIPIPNDSDPIADHSVKVPLSLVKGVEMLSETPAPVSN